MPDTASPISEIPALESTVGIKPTQAAALAARIIGALTLGWVYLAYTDLRWLLHLHALHALITKAPLAFAYEPYLAGNIVNVTVAIVAAGGLLVFPSGVFRALTPATGSRRNVGDAWFVIGIALGLIVLLLSVYGILATTLWTIYQSGNDAGWEMELLVYVLVAAGGVVLCRRVLATGHAG